MASRTYKLYTGVVASTFAATWIQIVEKCKVICIDLSGQMECAAAADSGLIWEVTTNSNLQAVTNDATGVLANLAIFADYDSAVARNLVAVNKSVPGLSYSMSTGERIYVNTQLIGTAPIAGRFLAVIHTI